MGLFDFFRKKEAPKGGNYTVEDLQVGYIIDIDLQSWEVIHIGTYDWGNQEFSYEAELYNGTEHQYLEFTDRPQAQYILYKELAISKLPTHIFTLLENGENPPRELAFEEEIYVLEENSAGYYSENNGKRDDDWDEVLSLLYQSKSGKYLAIDQWDEYEFEASTGVTISKAMIDQILPA